MKSTGLTPALTRPAPKVCYAGNPDRNLCSTSPDVAFTPIVSPLQAVVSGGNVVVGEGAVLLDASKSSDPDGEPGSIAFGWTCIPPGGVPGVTPCLDNSSVPLQFGPSSSQRVTLLGSPQGLNYTFALVLQKDSRVCNVAFFVSVRSAVRLPVISLQALIAAKVAPTDKLVINGAVTSSYPSTLVTQWSVVPPSPESAMNLLAIPGAAGTPLSSPSLVINAGFFLPPRQTVVRVPLLVLSTPPNLVLLSNNASYFMLHQHCTRRVVSTYLTA